LTIGSQRLYSVRTICVKVRVAAAGNEGEVVEPLHDVGRLQDLLHPVDMRVTISRGVPAGAYMP
jgi:hypothetical protein